jgi:parallel beta-helix repeat protein
VHDNVFTGNEIGVYLSAGVGVTSAVTVASNSFTGLNDDVSGHPEADDTYGVLSLWQGPNALITDNTITDWTYGIYLGGGAETVTSNAISANGTGVLLAATPARFAANSIVGNGVGASGAPGAGANWWGCNGGPNATGCDTATGAFTEPDWLVLSLALPVGCEVEVDGSLDATLSLATTAAGVVTTGDFVPPTAITPITGTLLVPDPPSGTTSNGVLPVTLTGSIEGIGSVSAQADNALVSAPGTSSDCVDGITVLPSSVVTELPTMGADPVPAALLALLALFGGAIAVRRKQLS